MILKEVAILLYCMHHSFTGQRFALEDDTEEGEPRRPWTAHPDPWEDLPGDQQRAWEATAQIVLDRASLAFPATVESLLRPPLGRPLEPYDT